jgi:hypothetical protein
VGVGLGVVRPDSPEGDVPGQAEGVCRTTYTGEVRHSWSGIGSRGRRNGGTRFPVHSYYVPGDHRHPEATVVECGKMGALSQTVDRPARDIRASMAQPLGG